MNEVSEQFKLWIKGCEINNARICLLIGGRDTAVYQCSKEYEYKNNYYNETPIYMVWIGGKNVLSTTNYKIAMDKYDNSQMDDL
jgi:hypothetical protein